MRVWGVYLVVFYFFIGCGSFWIVDFFVILVVFVLGLEGFCCVVEGFGGRKWKYRRDVFEVGSC